MRVVPIKIIKRGEVAERKWLQDRGYDGLACIGEACGCHVDHLYPCGERGDNNVCVPGHLSSDGSGIYNTRKDRMSDTLTDAIERHFRQHPGVWINQMELATVGGIGGWRTRCVEAEHRGLRLEKRQRTIHTADGRRLRISERRFVPTSLLEMESAG